MSILMISCLLDGCLMGQVKVRLSPVLPKCYMNIDKTLQQHTHPRVKILLSAALIDVHYEFRKQQYIESINKFARYGYMDVYIVEAIKKHGPTFLDDYSKNVFYATANDSNFRNNGINEARTVLEGSYYFNFDPEDMILKMTGRYLLLSDYFITMVENNLDYDALIKVNKQGDMATLCYAMKCKWLREMYEQMDYDTMEKKWINVETEAAHYINRKITQGEFKVLFVDKLDVEANLFGSSTCQSSEVLIF